MRLRTFAALLLLLQLPIGTAAGQEVRTRGEGVAELDDAIDAALRSNALVIRHDTTIARGDSVPGAVLFLGGTLVVEGAIGGDLVSVDGNVFLRPSARIHGDIVNAGGGLYPSTLARVDGGTVDRPLADYTVELHERQTIIAAKIDRKGPLKLDGIFGFAIPTYDRVNGLSVDWGASLGLDEAPLAPRLHGTVGYRTERGDLNGGVDASVGFGAYRLFGGAERQTFTNEEWIRSGLKNSVSYLFKGSDYRDYFEADRAFAGIEREDTIRGKSTYRLSAFWQLEDARSLRADDPWALFPKDSIRPNRPVSPGKIGSGIVGAEAMLIGTSSAVELDLQLESAREALGGDHDFERVRFAGEFNMAAMYQHRLKIEWMFSSPVFGTDSLPLQRWSFVGGSGTLHTLDVAQYYGDRIAFVETNYIIPLPQSLALPVVGPPEIRLIHAAGMAWTDAEKRDWVQEVGVRLDAKVVYFRVLVDPKRTSDPDITIGVGFPSSGKRPWEK